MNLKRLKRMSVAITLAVLFTTMIPTPKSVEAGGVGGYAADKALEAVAEGIGRLVGWIFSSKEEKPKQDLPATGKKEDTSPPAPAPSAPEPIIVTGDQLFDW